VIITWKAERDLYAPSSSVGVPVFAEMSEEKHRILWLLSRYISSAKACA